MVLLKRPALVVRVVRARDFDIALAVFVRDPDTPRIATDFAVLDEGAAHVGLDVDLDLFSAVRAHDQRRIVHIN